jgi:hypothetical protein
LTQIKAPSARKAFVGTMAPFSIAVHLANLGAQMSLSP